MQFIIKSFLIIFFSFLLSLGVFAKPTQNLHEKNIAQSFPTLHFHMGEDLNTYYQKSFATREHWVTKTSQILYKIGKSSVEDVIIGRGKNLLYKFSYTSPDLTSQEIDFITKRLKQLQKHFSSQDIEFIIAIAPDKPSLYPEMTPWNILGKSDNLYKIQTKMAEEEIFFLNLWEILNKGTSKPIYSPDETHWTHFGAVIALQVVWDTFSNTPLTWSSEEFISVQGDMAQMLHLRQEEVVPAIKITQAQTSTKVLFLHDSFGERWETLLPQNENWHFAHWKQNESIYQTIKETNYQPEVVVFQFVERDIPDIIVYDHVKDILKP